MPAIVNIAAYKFVTLSELPRRRDAMRTLTLRLGLKGTILLSEEGINLFLAGTREAIDAFLAALRHEPTFAGLDVKESMSDRQPFTRMLVRIKKEIIAFGVDRIDPRRKSSPRVSPKDLKQWLDEGRAVTLLDTRNDYEVKIGTFENALPAGIEDFRHFPDAAARLPEELKERPLVTFCTGGIRCEKASSYMMDQGFDEVYHLQGGILKYLENIPESESMWQGECFVFDQRVAVKHGLAVGEYDQCYACRHPLSPEELLSEKYTPGISCPHCYDKTSEEKKASLTERQKQVILAKQRGETHIGEKQK